jgi:hypothetical protein
MTASTVHRFRALSSLPTLAQGLVQRFELAGHQPVGRWHLDERPRSPFVAFDEYGPPFRDGNSTALVYNWYTEAGRKPVLLVVTRVLPAKQHFSEVGDAGFEPAAPSL